MNLGLSQNRFRKYMPRTGSPWTREFKSEIQGIAAVKDNWLAVQTADSQLHLVDLADGRVLWTLSLGCGARQVSTHGEIVFVQLDDYWKAIDLKTGDWIEAIEPFQGVLVGEASNRLVVRKDDVRLLLIDLKSLNATEVSPSKTVGVVGEHGVLKVDLEGNWHLGSTVEDSPGDALIGFQSKVGFLLGSCEDGLVFQKGKYLSSYSWSGELVARAKFSAGVNLVSFEMLAGVAVGKHYDPTTTKPGIIGFDLLSGETKWELKSGQFVSCGLSSSEEFCWLFREMKSSVELVCIGRRDGKEVDSQRCHWMGVVPTTSGLFGYSRSCVGTVDN